MIKKKNIKEHKNDNNHNIMSQDYECILDLYAPWKKKRKGGVGVSIIEIKFVK